MGAHIPAGQAATGGHPFLRAVAAISTVAGWCSAGMIVAAVGLTCQMIFIRFVLNGSTVWQTEAVVYLMVGATLVGLAYVQRLRGHVNVDLVPIALRPPMRRKLAIATQSLSVLIVAILLYYGVDYWHFAYERGWRSDTIWGVALWKPYLAIPVGFGLLLLQLVADLFALVKRIEPPFGLEEA